jgi:hypothetical protein
MFEDHLPWRRVMYDETTATDRQWLRMLRAMFDGVSHESLCAAGFTPDVATKILGVPAMTYRYNARHDSDK